MKRRNQYHTGERQEGNFKNFSLHLLVREEQRVLTMFNIKGQDCCVTRVQPLSLRELKADGGKRSSELQTLAASSKTITSFKTSLSSCCLFLKARLCAFFCASDAVSRLFTAALHDFLYLETLLTLLWLSFDS